MATETGPDENVRQQLKQVLAAIEASAISVLPGSDDVLLQSIVGAAAQIFGAAAASIALVDRQSGELHFRVAYGAGEQEVVGMRIPLNRGIAGYVAMTGQPIAISDVQEDPRFNREFAASTGYVPRSILATPLLLEDRVIGVMEILDKISAPSFGMQDMELLGVFAQQAAIAINQAQKIDLIGKTILQQLKAISADKGDEMTELMALLASLEIGEEAPSGEINMLATLYREIGSQGEAERMAFLKIMAAFVDYVRTTHRFVR
jgi:signal transduction protein with GAF and PtsI domain